MFRSLLIAATVVGAPVFAGAPTFEKNGLPCLQEICIGDGIEELRTVHWDRATTTSLVSPRPNYASDRKVSIGEMALLEKTFKGDIAKAAPYLQGKLFDAKAIEVVANVTVACFPSRLLGSFTSKGGNPTLVEIALRAVEGKTSEQRWTVIRINRKLPAAVSKEQQAEAAEELLSRYAAFSAERGGPKPKLADFGTDVGSFAKPVFGFYLRAQHQYDEGNRLKLHPMCGGSAKVKLD